MNNEEIRKELEKQLKILSKLSENENSIMKIEQRVSVAHEIANICEILMNKMGEIL